MKQSRIETILGYVNTTLLILLSIIMLYPYLNQIALSLNDGNDTTMGGITIFVRKFTWNNYKTILYNESIIRAFILSVMRVVIGVLISLVVVTSVAYALSKKYLPGRKKILLFLMIPGYIYAGMIPIYVVYRYYHLLNSFWVYVLPSAFVFYNFVIMRSFFEQLPESLEESALLDGANELQVLTKIIIPISMPVMATVALWVSVGYWNDWNTTLLYITNRKLFTMQYVLMQFIKESELVQKLTQESAMTGAAGYAPPVVTPESIKSAVFIIATIPIIAVYPFLQKYFVQGITLGAVKS